MPLAFEWEDLDAFLDVDEFATPVEVSFQGGGMAIISGIFDAPYLNAELGEYELDTNQPRLMCKAVDVAAVRRGDIVTIGGTGYDVLTNPQPDGTGMATLALADRPS